MGILMANANLPAAGRGVLAAQAGTPVLAARGAIANATGSDADTFGVTLQAEAADVADGGEGRPLGVEAEAGAEAAAAGSIQLFEEGDAADARQRRRGEEAAADAAAGMPDAIPAGAAMQASALPFTAGTRAAPAGSATDAAVQGADATGPRQGAALVLAPKAGTGVEPVIASIPQDGAAPLPVSAGSHVLPAGITLASGMTLDMPQLLPAAATNLGAAAGNAAGNALVEQLGERLHVQLTQRSEHALIRLDPPSMGRIEILISQEAGNTQVQMRASHPEVARQLHAIGEQLRQDLVQRQHGEVSVQVQDSWRDGEGRGRQRQPQQAAGREEPGHALREEDTEDGEAPRFALQS